MNASLDNQLLVETPEGVQLSLELAGFSPRAVAYLVDLLVRAVLYTIIAVPSAFLGQAGVGIIMIAFFLIEWGYPIIFEMYWDGATPGKRFVRIQVRQADGTPVSWSGSILRNVIRVADFLPVGYVFGSIAMLYTGKFQRLGDLAANTVVAYVGEGTTYDELQKIEDVSPVNPRVPLDAQESRAIVEFALREQHLHPDRSRELAMLMNHATGAKRPTEAVQRLKGIARGLLR